ncbi:MAG TPA: right-handed parallel beta-helix repeat-containing protein [Candidatus Dormibacteraeota bacterium]
MFRIHHGRAHPAPLRALVGVGLLVVVAGTALAATMRSAVASPALGCGDVITTSTTLQANLGPCNGDGLILAASGITLNLNGFTISGRHNGPQTTAGIFVNGQSHDIVVNGAVTGFDAGVAILGGGHNTVAHIDAHDNVNTQLKTGNANNSCNLGDGITTDNSAYNTIANNTVVHNGPYSGISLVDASTHNTVSNNTVENSNVINLQPNGKPGVCGAPFQSPAQDIGIRVEGPGASDNTVRGNTVVSSGVGGIAIHGWAYCPPGPTGCLPSMPQNTANVIENNYVAETGLATDTAGLSPDGISVLRVGPGGVIGVSQGNTIQNNQVYGNEGNGIFVGDPECGDVTFGNGTTAHECQPGPFTGTTVAGNTIQHSLFDGIDVPSGSVNNTISGNSATQDGGYDGFDGNVTCDSNSWTGDVFTTVNQTCVH